MKISCCARCLFLVCCFAIFNDAQALPSYDPFANATANGGTFYAVSAALYHQTNALGEGWVLWNGGSGSSTAEDMCVNSNLSYAGFPAGFPVPSSTNAVLIPGLAQGVNASGYSAALALSRAIAADANNLVTNKIYASFLLEVPSIGDLASTGTQPIYFGGFNNTAGGDASGTIPPGKSFKLFLEGNSATIGASTNWAVGIADNSGGATERFDPTFRAAGTVLFVVVDYEFGINGNNDNANLWVNPGSATFGATTAPAATTNITITASSGNEVGTAAKFYLYNRGGGSLWGSILFSDLRIGATWSFVTGGPEFTNQPVSQGAVAGATVVLNSAALAGGSTVSYQWQMNSTNLTNGVTFSGATNASLTISGFAAANVGSYAVVASDTVGSITSSNAVLTVSNADPRIVLPPQSTSVAYGGAAQFFVTPGGTTPFTYFWQFNGTNLTNGTLTDGAILSGAGTTNLTVTNATYQEAGSYSVVVTNIHGAVTSAPVVLTVNAALSITSPPQSRVETVGDNLGFAVAVSGSASFQWQFDGTNIMGATNSSFGLANIQTTNAGTYTVLATGSGTVSNSATLTVANGLLHLSPTNLIVARVGDGVQALSANTGNTLYLDQITANGVYVSTMMVPNSGPSALLVPGTGDGIYESVLTLSANGEFINFGGYNLSYPYQGGDLTGGGVTIRGIAAVNGLGYYTLVLTNIGLYSGGSHFLRAVVSTDGLMNFWTTGAASSGGIKYIAPGLDVTGSGIPAVGGGAVGTRVAAIFQGSVIYSDSEGNTTTTGINTFSGLPEGAASSSLMVPTGSASDPNDFAISPDGNTIYIADDNSISAGGGIQRWDFNQVQWTLTYILGTGINSTVGARGLAVDYTQFTGDGADGSGAIIYATTAEAVGNRLISISDTGASSSATVLDKAGPSQMLRGVRFCPTPINVYMASAPQSQAVALGTTVNFSASAGGDQPISYQWQFNGTNIAGATLSSLTVSNVSLASAGNYSVSAANDISATNATATLSLLVNTNVPVLLGAQAEGLTQVEVIFSAALSMDSATNLNNYAITGTNGAVTIFDAVSESGSNIILTVSTLINGAAYTLSVSNLANAFATNNIIAAGSQTNFIVSAYIPAGINVPSPIQTVLSNGVIISSTGALLNSTNDQAAFSGQLQTGNFDISVLLSGLGPVDVWSEAGIMARQSLDPGSPFAAALATPGMSGSFFEDRTGTNGTTAIAGEFPVNYPNTWLRLSRAGNVFTGYGSYDGQNWTQLGTVSIAMTDPIYLGFTVTSNNTNAPTTAQFLNPATTSTNAAVVANVNPHEPIGPCSRKTGIVFSEIMYKPAARADTNNLEFVEIYNSQPYFHDISGYQITCADMNYTFPPNTIMQAGTYIVVAASPGSMENVYGITNVMGPYTGSLKKSETLELLDEETNVLLTVGYSATYPWPVAASGTGHSIVLANPSYGEGDPRAWDISDVMGGSPGMMDSYRPSPLRSVVINEFLAHSENSNVLQFVELYNHSAQSVDLTGCILTDDFTTNKFVIPSGAIIPPAGFVSFDQNQLGFTLNGAGETLYFIKPDGTRILDAVQFEAQADGVSFGRWPDGANDFYPFTSATPGTNNSSIVIGNIVINELMYDPITESDDDQYIELYNQGTNAVSLAGWQFTAGVTFTFPTNAVIASNGYVVVGRNAANLMAKYTNLNSGNTFGNYSGKLSHNGERVALAMPQSLFGTNTIYVVEDEVTYGVGGRWGQWSGGGGSSLELIDPHANHRLAANWADSDETQKSQWTTISTTGVLDNGSNYTSGITYAQVGLLDAGECLVDNVQLIWNGTNYITNSTFENGLGGWNLLGDHIRSSLEPSGYQSSYSLHLRSSDKFWYAENSCEIFLPANNLAAGDTVTMQFQARWLRGWAEAVFHLDGNWLEAYGALPVPANLGSPGMPNSAYVTNAGPAIYQLTHNPSLPAANQAAVVTARIHDPDGVTNFTLYYRIDPSANYTAVPMVDNGTGGDAIAGDGIFSATIPGQAANAVVAFYLAASDSLGVATRFPAIRAVNNEPIRECVILFGDGNPVSSFGTYHLWMTQTNLQRWINLADLSNENMDCTFVNNNRVVYNMTGRFSTSPAAQHFNSPTGTLCTYEWDFPDDDKFLGATAFHKIHVPGNGGPNDASMQREQTSYSFLRALGLPWLYRRNVGLYVNGNRRGPVMEDTQLPDSDVVKECFPNDTGGWLYKFNQWYEFSALPSGVSIGYSKLGTHTLMPFTTTGGVKKLARYRPMYQIRRTPDSMNNFTNVYSLVDAASSYGTANYVANMENLANMENWLRTFAANHAVGNWDVYSAQTGQNLYGYIGAAGTKWSLIMWDMNIDLGGSGSWGPGANLFSGNVYDPNTENILNCPTFRRMYWRALELLIKGQFSIAGAGPLANAKYQAFINDNLNAYQSGGIENPNTAMLPWISQAQSSIAAQLAAVDASQFSVNPNVVVSNNIAYISGGAPVAVAQVVVNGISYPLTWTGLTNWTISVPLLAGTNQFAVTGVDNHGQLVAGATGSASATYGGATISPVGQVVINEIMYNPPNPTGQYVELYNNSTNVTFDLSGWQFLGLSYTFPSGSSLGPNSFLVLADNVQDYAVLYGATNPVFDAFTGALPTNGETTLTLMQSNGTVVAEVQYDSVAPWPTNANGGGSSLQLMDPTKDNWRVGNWAVSGLTPAATNAVLTSLPAFPPLWINEVQAGNSPFIELYNPTTNAVSLAGLYLTDDYTNLTNWVFPAGASINPGQFEIVSADGQTNLSAVGAWHTSFTLPGSTGGVALSRLYNSQPQVLDYVNYNNMPAADSYGSFPDGQSFQRQLFTFPTPGTANNGSVSSYVPYAALDTVYAQNFDSLPNPGSATVQSDNPVTINGVTYSLGNPFDFAFTEMTSGAGGLGLPGTMPGWYGRAGTAMKSGASAGDQSTGGVISFGATTSAATNRALGLLATSSTGGTAFALKLINETTQTVTRVNLSFTGELWRQQSSAKTLSFTYYIDATVTNSLSTSATTALTNLDVNFPVGSSASGNSGPLQSAVIAVTNQPIADWPPGTALWLVWQMTNNAGTSQGLAIDNFSFVAPNVYVPPVITNQPQNQIVNAGQSGSFTVNATSAFDIGYQWQFSATNLNGQTSATIVSSNAGSYDVIVSNLYGSVTSVIATLTVTNATLPPVITTQPISQNVPAGATAVFSVTADGTAPLTYLWTHNGTNIAGATTNVLTLFGVQTTNAGSYAVTVNNTAGSTNSQNAMLTVSAASFVAYTSPGAIYTQNFNSLPDPGTASVNTANPVTIAGVTYSPGSPFDFATAAPAGFGLSNTMAGWYGSANSGVKIGATAGDQTTGGVLSFGPTNNVTAATNRALGLIATSSTGGTAFGLRLINLTGETLTNLNLSFTSELWRQTATAKSIALFYYVDSNGTSSFSTNNLTAALATLSFAAGAGGATNWGTNSPVTTNQITITDQPITNWLAGSALWLTWQMSNPGGSGQGLGIDNLAFSASGLVSPGLPVLGIIQSASNAIISWSANASTNFVLQGTTNDPGQPGNWISVAAPIVVTNLQNTVTVPMTNRIQLFRLKQ